MSAQLPDGRSFHMLIFSPGTNSEEHDLHRMDTSLVDEDRDTADHGTWFSDAADVGNAEHDSGETGRR